MPRTIFFCFTLDVSIWDQNSFCWEKFGFLVKPVNPWHRQCLNYTKENLVEFASPPEAYFITSTLHNRTNNFFCVQRNCNVTELIFRITLKGKFNISFVMKGLCYIKKKCTTMELHFTFRTKYNDFETKQNRA